MNIQELNILYDSTNTLIGLQSIDLDCIQSNKVVLSRYYDINNLPQEVNALKNASTQQLTKIINCDGSYYIVNESYGYVLSKVKSLKECCLYNPLDYLAEKICNCVNPPQPNIVDLNVTNNLLTDSIEIIDFTIDGVSFPSVNNILTGETKTSSTEITIPNNTTLVINLETVGIIANAVMTNNNNQITGVITQIPNGYSLSFANVDLTKDITLIIT